MSTIPLDDNLIDQLQQIADTGATADALLVTMRSLAAAAALPDVGKVAGNAVCCDDTEGGYYCTLPPEHGGSIHVAEGTHHAYPDPVPGRLFLLVAWPTGQPI